MARQRDEQGWYCVSEGDGGIPVYSRHAPGRRYCRQCWPPRGRGRGEALTSPRRILAKLKAREATNLRAAGLSYAAIARQLGYKDRTAAWHAVDRMLRAHPYEQEHTTTRGRAR